MPNSQKAGQLEKVANMLKVYWKSIIFLVALQRKFAKQEQCLALNFKTMFIIPISITNKYTILFYEKDSSGTTTFIPPKRQSHFYTRHDLLTPEQKHTTELNRKKNKQIS